MMKLYIYIHDICDYNFIVVNILFLKTYSVLKNVLECL